MVCFKSLKKVASILKGSAVHSGFSYRLKLTVASESRPLEHAATACSHCLLSFTVLIPAATSIVGVKPVEVGKAQFMMSQSRSACAGRTPITRSSYHDPIVSSQFVLKVCLNP